MPRLMLSDDQYERIRPLLPGKDPDPSRTAADNRRFVKAVLGIARTGSPWRDLPPNFGLWNSVYNRFAGRSQAEIGHYRLCRTCERCQFRGSLRRQHYRAGSSACGRSSQKNGDPSIGRSREGLTTKIPARVDGLGMLAGFSLTGGQVSDTSEALPLLGELKPASLAADKAYDTNAILQHLESVGIQAVIPNQEDRLEQRPLDKHLYVSRNLIERFFCRIK